MILIKNIVCIGDSHTWGQGGDDFIKKMNPPVQQGDLRQMNFVPPNYVNLLRRYLTMKTDAYFGEITKENGMVLLGMVNMVDTPYISIGPAGRICVPVRGSMFRLQMFCGPSGSTARIIVDDNFLECISTFDEKSCQNNYRIWCFDGLKDGEHELVIENSGDGRIDLYRIDFYGGSHAVINSGIGSCDCGNYLADYWESHIVMYKPALVIVESFSINDWVQNTPLDVYLKNLMEMFKRIKDLGSGCMLLTASPIMGEQKYFTDGPMYEEYITTGIKAAAASGVPVADAFHRMNAYFSESLSLPEDIKCRYYEDDWHVNHTGHRIYFDCIVEKFKEVFAHKLNYPHFTIVGAPKK